MSPRFRFKLDDAPPVALKPVLLKSGKAPGLYWAKLSYIAKLRGFARPCKLGLPDRPPLPGGRWDGLQRRGWSKRHTFMETILNLLWLGVTLATLWLWRYRWGVSRRKRGESARLEIVALVCVLALLFPVISLTDDLHPEIVAVDSVSGKRNACLMAAVSHHARDAVVTASGTLFVLALLSPTFVIPNLTGTRFVLPTRNFNPTFFVTTRFGRSPPSIQ